MFGVSSVAGPLLGGFFTEGPGWRWIFWLNIPIGLAALFITSRALHMPIVRREHKIDYLGAGLIVASVSSILLYTSWAGQTYGWGDPAALALLIGGILLAVAFVFVELRAEEPIIPMPLFGKPVFRWSTLFAFLIGMAMFGGIVYLPLYLQVVRGYTPSQSGLGLLPMILGLLITSIGSGLLITGPAATRSSRPSERASCSSRSCCSARSRRPPPTREFALFIFLLGAGLGFTMQTIVVAVQNDVDRRDLGSATSGVTFFRMMGGAFGTAIFGAVLSVRITHYLADLLPAGAASGTGDALSNISAIHSLPADLQVPVLEAFMRSIQDLFLVAVPFVVVALVVSFLIPEKPLGTRQGPGEPAAEDAEPLPVALTDDSWGRPYPPSSQANQYPYMRILWRRDLHRLCRRRLGVRRGRAPAARPGPSRAAPGRARGGRQGGAAGLRDSSAARRTGGSRLRRRPTPTAWRTPTWSCSRCRTESRRPWFARCRRSCRSSTSARTSGCRTRMPGSTTTAAPPTPAPGSTACPSCPGSATASPTRPG